MSAVRIVGGLWRRTPLPVAEREGLRPTPDRVRETLFNWLGQSLEGWRVLDPFAGSGALGLEAASRGAAEVVIVERDRAAAAAIGRICRRFRLAADPASREAAGRIELLNEDVLRVLPRLAAAGRRFDLVLLDPPFGQGWVRRILPAIAPLLAPGARVYVEAEGSLAATGLPLAGGRLEPVRHGRAGQVHYHLLDYRPDPSP